MNFVMLTLEITLPGVENNQPLCPFLVEDSIAAGTTSYVILWFNLNFLLAIGAEILDALLSHLRLWIFLLVHGNIF